ncbi:hypothetical protein EIL50_02550 [bacterium NHP-B]|nr:hypothetical protein EIL50_02550 [bacterium NHP-B]
MALTDFLFSISFLGFFYPLVVGLLLTLLLALFVHSSASKTTSSKSSTSRLLSTLSSALFPLKGSKQNLLGKVFQDAMHTLRNYTGSGNFPYQLPFYLMVGSESAGKNTLLEKLDIPVPVNRDGAMSLDPPCDFWFFDLAVMMNLRGDLFMEKETTLSKNEEWRSFLRILRSTRPNQPLNGVVLCISAEELLTLDTQTLAVRANHVYEKFHEAQTNLGIKLPIFVVITKTDRVSGFSSFCHQIPDEKKGDIFGWSTPYSLDLPYHESWADEMFSSVLSQIMRLQQEMFVHGHVMSEKDGLCLFPHEFQKLKDPLSIYLKNLFSRTKVAKGLLLRGVFFVGDGCIHYHETANKLQKAMQASLQKKNLFEEKSNVTLMSAPPAQRDIYFNKTLFRDKIFSEQGLASPLTDSLLSKNYSVKIIQSGAILFLILGSLGLFHAYRRLDKTKHMIVPYVDEIGSVIQRAITRERDEKLDHAFFQKQARALLPAVINVYTHRLYSWFLPFSWLSPLETKIQRVVELAYYQVIFKAIVQKLNENMDDIVKGNVPDAHTTLKKVAGVNPLYTPFFHEMERYVVTLNLYQSMTEKYNSLRHSKRFEDFGFLVNNLFGFQVPSSFAQASNSFYTHFLSNTKESDQIQFFSYGKPAFERFLFYRNRFLDNGFKTEHLLPNLTRLVKHLNLFWSAHENYGLKDLRTLAKTLADSINSFSSPESAWLSQRTFAPGPGYETLLKKIALLRLFEPDTAGKFQEKSQIAFERLKGTLAATGSPVVGKIFTVDQDGAFHISTALLNFQGLLNLLLSQPFMYPPHESPPLKKESFDRYLTWNTHTLSEAIDLIKKFEDFFKNRLASLPPKTRDVLQRVCFHTLGRTVYGKIYDAQEFVPIDQHMSTLAPEETYLTEVRNLKTLVPVIGPLLSTLKKSDFTDLYTSLKDIVHDQALHILEKINAIYESEAPYEPRQDIVTQWRGNPRHVFAAFGASSQQDLKNYLTNQRERLRYLAKEFAGPAVELLKIIYTSDSSALPHLMLKWSDILTQLQFYERNAANTLQMLESFISTTLPSLTLEGCPISLHLAKNPAGIDYFLDRINSIRASFARQCALANRDASLASYKKITSYFNTHLAGRYPFTPKNFETDEDVSLEKLKIFFSIFDKEGPYVKELLTREGRKKSHYLKALNFIKSIEKTRAFFRLCIDTSGEDKAPSVPLEVTFRTQKDQEKQANQLISWSLLAGEKTVYAKNKTAKVWWSQGSPLKVDFRWALGSLYRPVPSSLQPCLNVDGLTASLSYSGDWALLKMLQYQHAEVVGDGDNQSVMVRFSIPTGLKNQLYPKLCGQDTLPPPEANELLVFMKIGLVDGNSGKSLAIPKSFPFIAPTLSQLEAQEAKGSMEENKTKACLIPKDPEAP